MAHSHNTSTSLSPSQLSALRENRRGHATLQYGRGEKGPTESGWQNTKPLATDADVLDKHAAPGANVGVVLGTNSGNLFDWDHDDPRTMAFSDIVGLTSTATFGRKSKPASHRLGRLREGQSVNRITFKDPNPPDGEQAMMLELRGDGHQTMFPGSIHPSGELIEWDSDGDIPTADLADQTRKGGLVAGMTYVTRRLRDGNRHDPLMFLAGALLHAGHDEELVRDLIHAAGDLSGGDDFDDYDGVVDSSISMHETDGPLGGLGKLKAALGLSDEDVKRLRGWIGGAESDDAEYHSAEDYWAYLPNRTYIHRESREHVPSKTVDDVIRPFKTGRTHKRGPKAGEPVYELPSVWLNRHRAVMGKTWAPGEPEIIEGRILEEGGWRDSQSMRLYNAYHAPHRTEGDPAQAQRWVDLAHLIYPDEAEHIIDWLAFKVQNPGVKINHALVFGGPQGIGKDTIAEPAIQAVGAWNAEEISPGTLRQEFNPWAKSVILRVSELRDLSPTEMFALYDAMKAIIAAPPLSVMVNAKYTPQFRVPNVTGVILTTNHRFGMYMDPDDRRHFCAWSERTKELYPDGFWDDFYRWLFEESGNAHVAAFLHARDLTHFNPKAPPRKTEWWHELVAANRTDEEHEFSDALEELKNPPAVTLPQIRATKAIAGNADLIDLFRQQKSNAKRFRHFLDRAGYVAVRNESTKDGRWKVDGQNTTIYAKKELTPRDRVREAEALTLAPPTHGMKQQKRMHA